MIKQNNFSRTLSNEAKMGAYYTDVGMCERIRNLFQFPDKECCILEPCIGDGSAIKSFLGKNLVEKKLKVFAVELNKETYVNDVCSSGFATHALNADFLSGVKISHNSFGGCFSNPPYGVDDQGIRWEQRFVEKLYPYLKNGAPLIYVIPYPVLCDEKFLKLFMSRFRPTGVYRFDDEIYKQFHQIVVCGVKKPAIGVLRSQLDEFFETVKTLENLPYLPSEPVEEPTMFIPSEDENIEYFTTILFDRKSAGENLYRSNLSNKLEEFFVPPYHAGAIGAPPIPLKKDLLYMLAVSGGGQGIVGSEDSEDLHLQRGCAKVVKQYSVQEDDGSDSAVGVERSFTQISLNVIENDGTITVLN